MRKFYFTIAIVGIGLASTAAQATKARSIVSPSGAYIASYQKNEQDQFILYSTNTVLFANYTIIDWADGAGGSKECSCNPPQYEIPQTTWPESFPNGFGIRMEHCDIEFTDYPYEITYYQNRQRTADAKVKLATGGRLGSSSQSLFVISASATEYHPRYYSTSSGTAVNPQDIKILGKSLGSDGKLYVVLPDNAEFDATPDVGGKDFYTYGGKA